MLLTTVNQKIQAFIEGAAGTNPNFFATYADMTFATFVPGASAGDVAPNFHPVAS